MLIRPIRSERSRFSGGGFTLLEVLIAAAIFVFAIAGIFQIFIKCTLLDQANRNKSIATTHAETAMEYIKSLPFSTIRGNLCTGDVPPVSQSWLLDLGPETLNLSGLTDETVNVTTSGCVPSDWLEITVDVTWKDRAQATPRNLTLETAISQ